MYLKISSNVLWMSAKAIAHCQNSLSEKNLRLAISISRWLFSFSVGGILRGQKLDNHRPKNFKRPEKSGADDDIEEEFFPLLDHPRRTKISCNPRASQCHLEGRAGQSFDPIWIAGHNPFPYCPSKYSKSINLISEQNDSNIILPLDMFGI